MAKNSKKDGKKSPKKLKKAVGGAHLQLVTFWEGLES